ncbi:MAG: hypothetical protein KDH96_04690 [Candidatus Riesia sp.]|nr:hypothetical protein [Candidatus Riesia sp.]
MTNQTQLQAEECRLLTYLYKNPELFRLYGDSLKSVHFSWPVSVDIFNILKGVWDRHKVVPSPDEFDTLAANLALERSWGADYFAAVKETIASLPVTDVTEITGDALSSYIVNAERQQLAKKYLDQSLGDWVEDIPSTIQKLQRLQLLGSTSNNDKGIYPFDPDLIKNPVEFIAQDYGGEPILTGMDRLDSKLAGGLKPSELVLLVAPTGFGKSLSMINIALNVISQFKRVMYFALDNPRAEMLERIWTTATGVPITEEKVSSEWSEDIALSQGGEGHHRFYLEEHSPRSMTTLDLRRAIQMQKSRWKDIDLKNGVEEDKAGRVDLVIIDYADMLRSDRHYAQYRMELQQIFHDLLGIAKDEKCVVMTASQANREALGQQNVTLKNLSEAFCKAFPCSHVWAFCQTLAERHLNTFRWAVLKARRNESQYLLHMLIDYNVMRITDNPMLEPEPLMETGNPSSHARTSGTSNSAWQTEKEKVAAIRKQRAERLSEQTQNLLQLEPPKLNLKTKPPAFSDEAEDEISPKRKPKSNWV